MLLLSLITDAFNAFGCHVTQINLRKSLFLSSTMTLCSLFIFGLLIKVVQFLLALCLLHLFDQLYHLINLLSREDV